MALTPLLVKKIGWIIGFMVFKSTGSDSQFQRKNRFEKYAQSHEILAEMCPNSGRQTKSVKFLTFWPISRDAVHIFKVNFYIEIVSSSRLF